MFLYYIGMITLYYWMEALFPLTKRAFPVKERMIGINYD